MQVSQERDSSLWKTQFFVSGRGVVVCLGVSDVGIEGFRQPKSQQMALFQTEGSRPGVPGNLPGEQDGGTYR